MKNIHIRGLCRLGNSIIQIKNAIQIALFYNYNIILPQHPMWNTTYIIINPTVTAKDEKIIDKHNFYQPHLIEHIDQNVFKLNKEKTCNLLRYYCKLHTTTSLDKNSILLHIRSGDIFKDGGTHADYLPPPLSYYVNILKQNEYKTIYLVCEDTKNPVIDQLLQLYPNIIFKLQNLEDDINLILNAPNIVMSIGSFIPSLLLFSDSIKTLYIPSHNYYLFRNHDLFIYNIDAIHIVDISKYYAILGPWKNTVIQRNLLLTYAI